jgi:pimeloyl-ACP methyl ester carboxylesterase
MQNGKAKHNRTTAMILLSLLLCPQGLTANRGIMKNPTKYKTIQVDGVRLFYREGGPSDAPVILLLHGLPSSSRMFEPLLSHLSDRFHLVAPDYPGFGHSDWPSPVGFDYTFDHLSKIITQFAEALKLPSYTLYMQDYGGPVGFRMALAHPERVEKEINLSVGDPTCQKMQDV